MSVAKPDNQFWHGKRVLVTGHTGFKGAWLTLWLNQMGAKITGVSLPPNTAPNLFELADLVNSCDSLFCDIRDAAALAAQVKNAQPEVVFHLAAQPLVRASYREPRETFAVNIMGTANLLDALRSSSVRVAVMITTDKVYRNNEWSWPYREDDALGGHDPYSASKAACEIVIDSYRKAFFAEQGVAVASARAGNVIGGGDWSEDRLVPDAVRAWQSGSVLHIRRPDAVRPWQHVLEPLAGYLVLAQQLWTNANLAGAYNFGPLTDEAATVREVIELARTAYGNGEVRYGNGSEGPHEAGRLVLEIAKVKQQLGFQPRLSLTEAIQRTMAWYKAQHSGADVRRLCEEDIAAYEAVL
ncbi:MAG: CDP-glucose 4,6-dehydratase [Candidatus Electronema sp. V4]|uniref:CDP-glucose 4,6-dehydratase n=1 Tax=Candidatus Electronema sp. V4 TaxID=3454756 RepID=UPI0040555060